ncbi:PucR family transcriptional regulator [Erysipelotrichaceae bacterium OttesenSCG-928-M19]|nr:PucR family transcriptional regulator [Erysipelotrichaceae bacterium OttesenSCG-928-M19]
MLSLKELLKNPLLQQLDLVIDNANLDVNVTNVGVVDYEFDVEKDIEKSFYQGEFLITSMLIAKDNEELFYKIIETLIKIQTCAIAIKKIYYQELPPKIKKLAEEHRYPIFLYGDELTFEEIIYEVLYDIKRIERINYYQQIIDNILSDFITNQKALDLLNLDTEEYYVFCIHINDKHNQSILRNANFKVYPYQNSFIIFGKRNHDLTYYVGYFKDLLQSYSYHIGISQHNKDLKTSIKRSIDNAKLAKHLKQDIITFEEINFLYVVIDNYQNEEYQNFMINYLKDVINDEQMMDTLINFIRYEGDIKHCAQKMFVHENTIRYRINKAHEIIEANASDLEFYKSLSIAITIYLLTYHSFVI